MDYWEDYEVLRVETPELLELRLPLAGFGPRFMASVIDYLIIGAANVVLVLILLAVGSASASFSGSKPSQGFIFTLVIFLLIFLMLPTFYFCYFEQVSNGQSPGKRAAGIRVVKRGGIPLEFPDVLIRNLLRMVDWLPSNGFTALVSFFATRNQQRLGDLAADTVVIREFRSRLPLGWGGSSGEPSAMYAPGTLTPQLNYIIQNYLLRASSLSEEVRRRICRSCIRRLGYDPGPLSLPEQEHYLASILQGSMAHYG